MRTNHFAWEENFPSVYGHTSIAFLKQCAGFREAKHGDMRAALKVAQQCINSHIILEVRQRYPDAIALPVITNNKLPEALAEVIGIKTHTGVQTAATQSRKSLNAMERLLHKPVFCGSIVKGKDFIIFDDIITQGGTVSELRKYVIANGGSVAAIVALSCSVDSKILAPTQQDIICLVNRFSSRKINSILREYNIACDLRELTRAQIRYLLRFKEPEGLIRKIEQTQMRACAV